MGLKVEKTTPHGVSVSYARIRRVSVDADLGRVEATLAFYVSEEARMTGAQPLWYEEAVFPLDDLPEDFRAAAYIYITGADVPQIGIASGSPLVSQDSPPVQGPGSTD